MTDIRVAVAVSPDQSDIFFANQLIERVNVVAVIVENQLEERDNTPTFIKALRLLKTPSALIQKIIDVVIHKRQRKNAVYNKTENLCDFGPQGDSLRATGKFATLYTKGVNDINEADQIRWLKKIKPDLIAVCGASIFKQDILSIPKYGVLNLHGGLAQQYRGLFTTDWAIHNQQPEYVGSTVHFISPGIDDGDIMYQSRPDIEVTDNPNSLYVKIVKKGIDMMERAIIDIQNGTAKPTPLPEKGRLYTGKMFTYQVKAKTWATLETGLLKKYLENKQERDKEVIKKLINPYPESEDLK